MPFVGVDTSESLLAAAGATGAGTAIDLSGVARLAVEISGTFVATVTFQGSMDGTNYVTVTMSPVGGGANTGTATAPGMFFLPAGMKLAAFRCNVTAFTSGTITANSIKSPR